MISSMVISRIMVVVVVEGYCNSVILFEIS